MVKTRQRDTELDHAHTELLRFTKYIDDSPRDWKPQKEFGPPRPSVGEGSRSQHLLRHQTRAPACHDDSQSLTIESNVGAVAAAGQGQTLGRSHIGQAIDRSVTEADSWTGMIMRSSREKSNIATYEIQSEK